MAKVARAVAAVAVVVAWSGGAFALYNSISTSRATARLESAQKEFSDALQKEANLRIRPEVRARLARGDLYALGVIAHEMLIGKRPEPAQSRAPLAGFLHIRRLRHALLGAGITLDVAALIARLLAPHPRMRPASATEVATLFAKASEAARDQ
jgi:hypothetical protein